MSGGERPLGITLICIFGFIGSIISLLIMLLVVFIGLETGFLASFHLESLGLNFSFLENLGLSDGIIIAGLLVLLPLINLFFWYLLWKLNILAWLLIVGTNSIVLYFALINQEFEAAIFPGIIILYLLVHLGSFLE